MPFPVSPLRLALRLAPAPLLAPALDGAMRRLARAAPALTQDLARLEPGTVLIAPTDLPRRFLLRIGAGPPRLGLAGPGTRADATVSGPVGALFALAEGRLDSDALFFSHALTITGATATMVALHNTLERHGTDLLDALMGPLAGPLATPVRRLAARFAEPRAVSAAAAEPPAIATLRAELARLATRLTALERRARTPA